MNGTPKDLAWYELCPVYQSLKDTHTGNQTATTPQKYVLHADQYTST